MMAILPRILITGATGFVGQHLLEAISPDNYHIRILTRNPYKPLWCSTRNIEIMEGDLADTNAVSLVLKDVNVVINLAAELRDISKFELTNVRGVENLIAGCVANKIERVIHRTEIDRTILQLERGRHHAAGNSVSRKAEGPRHRNATTDQHPVILRPAGSRNAAGRQQRRGQ